MKKLSREEFTDRMLAVQRARRIFVETGLLNNISMAFEVYQEEFAETDRRLKLNTKAGGRRQPSFLDDHYIKPTCPDCKKHSKEDVVLYLRLIKNCQGGYIAKGPANKFGWKSVWMCDRPDCMYEQYSKMSLEDWQKKLPRRG